MTPKAPQSLRNSLPFLTLAILLALPASAANLTGPVGELDVTRQHIRTGTHVVVSWKITYPTDIEDVVTITPDGRVITRTEVELSVRAIGQGHKTVKSNNGHGNNIDGVDVSNPGKGGGGPNGEVDRSGSIDDEKKMNGNARSSSWDLEAALWIRDGETSDWEPIYHGTAADLDGDHVYYRENVSMNDAVDFAARGRAPGGEWDDVVTTVAPSSRLIALTDGDELPERVGRFSSSEVATYLSSYVDKGRVVLGPHEVIYLFDLDSAGTHTPLLDLQDLGVHVSFVPTQRP